MKYILQIYVYWTRALCASNRSSVVLVKHYQYWQSALFIVLYAFGKVFDLRKSNKLKAGIKKRIDLVFKQIKCVMLTKGGAKCNLLLANYGQYNLSQLNKELVSGFFFDFFMGGREVFFRESSCFNDGIINICIQSLWFIDSYWVIEPKQSVSAWLIF